MVSIENVMGLQEMKVIKREIKTDLPMRAISKETVMKKYQITQCVPGLIPG
jgi:hypothetical protein